MFYRYELMVDEEYQDVGIFQGLDELDLDIDVQNFLMENFNKNLPYPSCLREKRGLKTRSYFTEKGNTFFLKDIERIVKAFNCSGLFWVRKVQVEILPKQNIVYQDKYQILISI